MVNAETNGLEGCEFETFTYANNFLMLISYVKLAKDVKDRNEETEKEQGKKKLIIKSHTFIN